MKILKDKKIFLAGHNGLVGSAMLRKLKAEGYEQIVTRSRKELDLTNQADVNNFFSSEQPKVVVLAAAKVGGILANKTYPADFIRDNLMIQSNVIDAAFRYEAEKFIFLGSSCIYPKFAPQPMKEEHLLTSELEPTNEFYAVAKIAGLKMCQAYFNQYGFNSFCVMPTNLYGPNDNFDLSNSHVLPALIKKFHEAKLNNSESVEIWGSGTPRREFLHADDLAEACLYLLNQPDDAISTAAPDRIINVGVGEDITIDELSTLIKDIVGFQGGLTFDSAKPDGTPRKLLDITRIRKLGWTAKIPLKEGITDTYQWFMQNHKIESPAQTETKIGNFV